MSERDKELRRKRKRREKRLKARIREAVKASSRRTANQLTEFQPVVKQEVKSKDQAAAKPRVKTKRWRS